MAKYQTKAEKRLAARVKAYEEAASKRTDKGRGIRRPGSMKTRH